MKYKIFLLFLVSMLSYRISFSTDKEIDIVKERVITELLGPAVDDAVVEILFTSIKEDGTWPGINYQDVSNEGFEHRIHLGNMVYLARAYKTKSSNFYKNKKVKKAIESALENWVDNDYICENWWHNQIGTPNGLVSLMLIIGNELPDGLTQKAQPMIGRANIDAPGARPGGDRIKIAGIQAKNALYLGDVEEFNLVIQVIESEIKQVAWVGEEYGYGFRLNASGFSNRSSGGRGIQYDYSFHHRVDGVNNTLSYGMSYADAFIEWADYTSGTVYEFSETQLMKLIDYYLDGICKTAVYGKYPDAGAKNRSISREHSLRPYNAKSAEKLLSASDYRKEDLSEIADIRNKGIKPTLSHATFYWNSEHFTYQRPDFFTSVRMYSTRNYNMEEPYNSEGLLNHYRGDGANHISVTGDEYYDIWPVYDYRKIPGTTIVQRQEMLPPDEIQQLGLTDFVGAVTDGLYGAAAFDFKSPHDPVIGRKSWFFFDEEYVCLGAGISSRKDLPVVTTLNQCLLRDDVTILQASKKSVLDKGEKSFEDVDWVFQDAVGYVFPKPTTVNIKNSQATGSWRKINKQSDSPKDEVKLDVFKLWIEHGNKPSDATYEYIVVPATSVDQLEKGNSKKNIKVLSNTPKIQAVEHTGLQMYQIVFHKAGEIKLSDDLILSCSSPGMVMLKTDEQGITELSVSDPNRELAEMHITVSEKAEKTGDGFSASWDEKDKKTNISVDLPQGNYAGKSVTINLR